MESLEHLHSRLHTLTEEKQTAERSSDPEWARELAEEIAEIEEQIAILNQATSTEQTEPAVLPEAIPPTVKTTSSAEIVAEERRKINAILADIKEKFPS